MADSLPLLVTSALPYANGPLHLGHMVEHVQSDIFVRFQRLLGRDVLYVGAADTHGTAIELKAMSQGIEPAVLVEQVRQQHARDDADFDVALDIYYTTNSEENRLYSERVYAALRAGGHITEKMVEQFYCEKDTRFLPDRFVKGTCPFCGTADQYGDVCESCNKTYRPTELKSPYCVICRTPPVRKESLHYFVRLADFTDFLREFSARLAPDVRNYVSRWIEEGLLDWDISRDGPYFGFPIPGATNKFFYVWVDAPIGYIGSAAHLAKERGLDLAKYWPGTTDRPASSDQSEIVHFIGKDINYFHTLFWPAMLHAAGFAVPSRIQVHGMLNFGGEKMSKSRGRMITARKWLDSLDPTYLRYYLGANLGPGLDDLEFSLDELANRVNSQLINNVGNLANRSLSFIASRLGGKLVRPTPLPEETAAKVAGFITRAKQAYLELNYREAIRNIEALGSWANEFQQSAEPWKVMKTDHDRAHADLSLVVNVAKALATMLSPIVPRFSKHLLEQINVAPQSWDDGVQFNLGEHTIGTPRPLLPKLEPEVLAALFAPATVDQPAPAATPAGEPLAPTVAFEDFAKVDLRVGVVLTAERVPKADKLLRLSVDLGEGTPRTIASGIATAYDPKDLVGRRIIVVANLAPRTIRGIESRGMLLAASTPTGGLVLASVPDDAAPGTQVK
jgi:methionyl-tRNA synthetase